MSELPAYYRTYRCSLNEPESGWPTFGESPCTYKVKNAPRFDTNPRLPAVGYETKTLTQCQATRALGYRAAIYIACASQRMICSGFSTSLSYRTCCPRGYAQGDMPKGIPSLRTLFNQPRWGKSPVAAVYSKLGNTVGYIASTN